MSDQALVYRFDVAALGAAKRTPQGFLKIPAYLTRVGVFEYRRADGTVVRELRPRDEIFKADSLATLSAAPVTDLHPSVMISPANVRELQIGHVSDDVREDGEMVAGHVTVQEASAIAAVERGDRHELSCGYQCRIDETPGVFEGAPYDQVQRDIVYNHVAIGPRNWGRAGRDVALRVDSADAGAETDVFRLDAGDALSVTTISAPKVDDIALDAADNDEPDDVKYEELLARAEALQGKLDAILLEREPERFIRDETERAELALERDTLQARADDLTADLATAQRELAKARAASSDTQLVAERDALLIERDTLQARCDGLGADLADARRELAEARAAPSGAQRLDFDRAVHERAVLVERARRALPAERLDGLTTARQIHEAVLQQLEPELDQAGRDDSYLAARFDAALERLDRSGSNLYEARRITSPRIVRRADDHDEPDVPDWMKPLSFSSARTKEI